MHENEGSSPVAIEYEPVNVKDLLIEMKDTAELLIDLSYSAVLYQDEELAREVLRLEHRMDVLEMRARMGLMMAARSPNDTEQLAPVLGIVTAADLISDAAGDIAKILLDDIGLPEAMRAALPDAVETLRQGVVGDHVEYAGKTLEEIDLESQTGVRVIALRRGEDWLLNPGPATRIESGDVAFMRGPETAVVTVYESMTGNLYSPPTITSPDIDDLERAVDTIIHMKNFSELAVDLAYSSVLFNSQALAEEVRNLEIEVNEMQTRFEAWTLQAAVDAPNPVALRGLIRLGTAAEVISDAALDITEGARWEIGVHPVVQLAVEESDEIITRFVVEENSALDGVPVVNGLPEIDPTMSIIAIRRPGEGWLLIADTNAVVAGGDILISKGTRTAAAAFEELSIAAE